MPVPENPATAPGLKPHFFPVCAVCSGPMRLATIEPHARYPKTMDVRRFVCDGCSRIFDETTPRDWLGVEPHDDNGD